MKKIPSRAIAYGTRAPLKTDEFIEPSAEITIANVTHAAAPCPITRSTTSEATCADLATLWGAPKSTDPGAFAFRMYRPEDKVSLADLVSVRKQLAWRGLLSEEAFDASLCKASG